MELLDELRWRYATKKMKGQVVSADNEKTYNSTNQ